MGSKFYLSAVFFFIFVGSKFYSSTVFLLSTAGESESAQQILQGIIERDQNLMEAHLLMAQIHLHLRNIKQSAASLELALSSNFEVCTYTQCFQLVHFWSNFAQKSCSPTSSTQTNLMGKCQYFPPFENMQDNDINNKKKHNDIMT